MKQNSGLGPESDGLRHGVGWLLAFAGFCLLFAGGVVSATTDSAGAPLAWLPGYLWILIGLGMMSVGLLLAGIPWI
jgi:hypothetical protein